MEPGNSFGQGNSAYVISLSCSLQGRYHADPTRSAPCLACRGASISAIRHEESNPAGLCRSAISSLGLVPAITETMARPSQMSTYQVHRTASKDKFVHTSIYCYIYI